MKNVFDFPTLKLLLLSFAGHVQLKLESGRRCRLIVWQLKKTHDSQWTRVLIFTISGWNCFCVCVSNLKRLVLAAAAAAGDVARGRQFIGTASNKNILYVFVHFTTYRYIDSLH